MCEIMCEFDELKIYRGSDIQITPDITVTQPTLDQIERFGEKRYFDAVHTLCATGADLKWQLWDYANIDYTKIDDYELFVTFISQIVSSKKKAYEELAANAGEYEGQPSPLFGEFLGESVHEMLVNPLELILKDIDLGDFIPCKNTDTDQIILYNPDKDITIDRIVYTKVVDVVRRIHGLKRNDETPGNEITKMVLIEDAREDAKIAADKPYKSVLMPLVSALTVKCGLCGDDKVWNMKINQFLDNIRRANKIQEAQLLLQGAYSGFASLKGVDKSKLDWTGDI